MSKPEVVRIYPGSTFFDKRLLQNRVFKALVDNWRKTFAYEDEFFDRIRRRYIKNKRPLVNLKTCSFPTGILPYVAKKITPLLEGVDWEGFFVFPGPIRIPRPEGLELREFQEEIFRRIESGIGRGIFIIPTGSGKTLVEVLIAIGFWRSFRKSVYIVSPRRIINEQIEKTLQSFLSPSDYPHNIHVMTDRYFSSYADSIDPEGLVIWDEVHISQGKVTWGSLIKSPIKYRLGFTATLPESKKWRVVGAFGPVLVHYKGEDAVKKGWIEKPHILLVRVSYKGNTDFLEEEGSWNKYVSRVFQLRIPLVRRYVSKLREQGRKILLLVSEVREHLIPLRDELGCPIIHGDMDKWTREQMIEQFRKDGVIAATYGVFQLGVDLPELDTLLMVIPSKSEVRIVQSLGRTLRKKEGKQFPLLIFFVDSLSGLWKYGKSLTSSIKKTFGKVADIREIKEVVNIPDVVEFD